MENNRSIRISSRLLFFFIKYHIQITTEIKKIHEKITVEKENPVQCCQVRYNFECGNGTSMGNPDEISDFQFQGFSDFVALQTLASFAIWDFKIKKINIIFINLKSTFLVKVPILLHNKQV